MTAGAALPFKISVLVFLRDEAGRLLLIQRTKAPNLGCWSPIGGKLEMGLGESPFECAVRETFEETGLLLAAPAPVASVAGPWREFRAVGALPDLAALSYVARAITPPGRSRRFDARFFMAGVDALLHPEPTAGSGELDEIAWLPVAETRALDVPAITRFVLGEVRERLAHPDRPLPSVRMVRGRHVIEHQD